MFDSTISFIRDIYQTDQFIPLHEPRFVGNEKEYLNECIDSTFVSSVGKFVDQFEEKFASFVKSPYAIAVVNGTQALFIALKVAGVLHNEEVLTQSLTFVATANAISYTGAVPIFLDVDQDTLGLSPEALQIFLEKETIQKDGATWNRKTGRKISACVPMHTFGNPCRIDAIQELCKEYQISLVEDAAESLGSSYKGQHTGTFGELGIFSFNGNKIITTGGGGMIVTENEALAKKLKHLTTTAKMPHRWAFEHDEIGYNYRLPNLNAALGVAQLEQLPAFLEKKWNLTKRYQEFFKNQEKKVVQEIEDAQSNYWLNAILLENREERNSFLDYTNENGIMTRSLWTPMHQLSIYKHCQSGDMKNTDYLYDRVVNIPSSVK